MLKSSINNAFLSASGLALTLALAAMPGVAHAQDADSSDADAAKEIVVTGTLIRGVAPTGSQAITVDATAITQAAPATTNDLLAKIPQINNFFNDRPFNDPRSAGQISINRPGLRNLPGVNSSSGSVTLVMVDGHRITPVGTNAAAIDVDVIPTAVLERVDLVTDGGSSLYGADAVSGVINFITRKKFEGVKVDANFGFGTTLTSYKEWNGSITAGKSWSSGNAYISVGHNYNSNVLNNETDWAKSVNFTAHGVYTPSGLQCPSPVGATDTYNYVSIPGRFTGWTDSSQIPGGGLHAIGSPCDLYGQQSYTPKHTRTNVFASVTQQLSDNIEFHATAYWTKNRIEFANAPLGYTSVAAPAPTGAPGTPGAPASSPVTVSAGTAYSYGVNAAYVERKQTQSFDTWGINPELMIKLGGDWQNRTTLHYGESNNHYFNPGVNSILTNSDIATGKLNPLNVAAASSSVIAGELDWQDSTDTKQTFLDIRSIADGPLFDLPGGKAKLAVGVEYQRSTAHLVLIGGPATSTPLGNFHGSRDAESIFGELSLPVATILDVSASLRYDHYSDFGSTTNPTIGAKLKPLPWLSIYGHWGKSFNAPTVIDSFAISTGAFFPAFGNALLLNGSGKNLQPQTATSWALGFDARPISNLSFGVEYYDIDFKNILAQVDPTTQTCVTNPGQIICAPQAGILGPSYVAQTLNAASLNAAINGATIGQIVDRRTTNLQAAVLRGLDFHLNYSLPTDHAGTFTFGLTGNKQLKFDLSTAGVAGSRDNLLNNVTFTASGNVGWSMGGFSSRVTVNYTGAGQTTDFTGATLRIKPWVITNLFLGYTFDSDNSVLKGTSVRLNVDNLFNKLPQFLERNASANQITYARYTLGRVIKLGFTKEF